MGRRNGASKAPRRVQRSKPRRFGDQAPPATRKRMAPPPPTPVYRLQKMVLPVGKCGRKLKFANQTDAEKALEQAKKNRARRGQPYREARVYWHRTCDGWHMTSLNYDKNEVQA